MLLGRGQECARLDGLLAAAREDRSGALVIRGEAGVGKTALLRYALESAPDMTVLQVDGVESESELAFAGLADLLRPVLDRLERIPPPQAEALRGALALAPAAPGDPFAVSAGTLSLLATAAESRPLLALVDDAHWLDASSAAVMAFAARRLGREGVVLLFAMRAEEPGAIDLAGIPELPLAGLGREESEALLVAAGAGTIAPDVAAALHEATGGNPLALLELPALLSEAQLEGLEPLGYPVPAGEGVQRSFLGRVRRMPPQTRRALTVAAASEDGDLDAIARAAAELGTDASSLEPAESAGLIRLARGRVAWRHPLLRAAIYQDADAAERRAAHRALAHALAGSNRAWHLAAGALAPEESVAHALEEAARAARGRNAYAAAGSAFERAASLTPELERSARRLLEAGRDFQLVGRSAHALDLLDQALPSATDPLLRAEIHHARGALEMWGAGPVRAQEHLVGEAERIVELDPAQAATMLADAAILCTMTGDCRAALATSRRAESIAPRTGEPLRGVTEALLSSSLILCGQARAASPSLRRLRRRWYETDPLASPPLVHAIGHGSLWIEDFAEARRVLERAIEAARAASAGALLSFPLALLAELNFRIGRWAEAYSEASESAQVAEETQQLSQSSFALVCLAEVEAGRGLEDDCRAHARRAGDIAVATGAQSIATYSAHVLGLLELGLGRPAAAVEALEPLVELTQEHGLEEPGVVWWTADLVEAYIQADRRHDAERVLERLERQAASTGRTWALATGARCRGLLASKQDFDRHFAEALRWHARKPTPFERARTDLRFGQRLRRTKQPSRARGPLRAAHETFHRLGARPWEEVAAGELRSIGERVEPGPSGGLGQLTPRELQIALAVARGATNREAAASLFLSPKTVEYHLGKTYAKLGVRSRTELAVLVESAARSGAAGESG